MRARRSIVALLVAVLSGAFWMQAAPASAQCYPQKPQTCVRCTLAGVEIKDTGEVVLIWECA